MDSFQGSGEFCGILSDNEDELSKGPARRYTTRGDSRYKTPNMIVGTPNLDSWYIYTHIIRKEGGVGAFGDED